MTNLVIADHAATFTVHPLEGSSRFSLLGLLAGLNGLGHRGHCDSRFPWVERKRAPLERTSEGTK